MSSNGSTAKKLVLLFMFLVVLATGLWNIANFFDIGVTIDTLKERVGVAGIGLFVAAIAGIISLKD